MTESKSLKKAVDAEVKDAEKDARTGTVSTVPESEGGPATDAPKGDQPTGARSHPQ